MTDYICILDFEATCWDDGKEHEIIEFPSVLLKWENKKIYEVSRIQNFVKPFINPAVSEFCHNLTGITQEQVDNGMTLQEAMKEHTKWLIQTVGSDDLANHVTIVTAGNWDLATMLPMDLKNLNLKADKIYKKYGNIKDFGNRKRSSMVTLLSDYNLELEGRHHSGIDDCHNIARIFIEMVKNGLNKREFKSKIHYLDDEKIDN
jgi:inhibitor of KinA sporulation pathway (predicted exonuclease)